MNIQTLIEQKATQAFHLSGATDITFNPAVRQAAKTQFGDYQINGVMGVAKQLKLNPRAFAEQVLSHLDLTDIASRIEIAGPGFINIFLHPQWLSEQAKQQNRDATRTTASPQSPQTIVVDYSAPNVAKEMHVGHLRSTIIGDAIVKTFEFLGHHVIRANHIGDWGTQFGMLIANLERIEQSNSNKNIPISMEIADLESFYRESKVLYDTDDSFAETARQYVVKLQGGDDYCLSMWQKLVEITLFHNQQNYDRLHVSLSAEHVMGESMYNPMLNDIVVDLKKKGLAVESDGAIVIYLDEYKTKDGDPMGVIIQKKDGAFLYTTTDIVCAKYRYEILHADRILYFVDSRQQQHLQQAWSIVRKAGYVPESVSLEHHAFGMMLGKDGRPFKTRTGGTVRLSDLLDEAETRALALVESKQNEYTDAQKKEVAHIIGIGAIKYADLSKNRTTDYIFDWDNMLAFEGNTAPYMQYAYARICSIFRKAEISRSNLNAPIRLETEQEHLLVCALLQFEEMLADVATSGEPHLICTYLYRIAGLFSRFYEACPILKSEDEAIKQSRLTIAAFTAKTIKQSLDLLGIETLEQM